MRKGNDVDDYAEVIKTKKYEMMAKQKNPSNMMKYQTSQCESLSSILSSQGSINEDSCSTSDPNLMKDSIDIHINANKQGYRFFFPKINFIL